jgi:hypothetical protein
VDNFDEELGNQREPLLDPDFHERQQQRILRLMERQQ